MQQQRHEQFLLEEVQHIGVQQAASMRRPHSCMLNSFTLICHTRFHSYSVLTPYSTGHTVFGGGSPVQDRVCLGGPADKSACTVHSALGRMNVD